jgi:crotonobetainyl-CoA:carnitine CoA-transferase CaiB-like acyl-CoA transferase
MVEWMSYPLYYAISNQPPPPRTGAAHATIFPYGPFVAGDGKTVMLGLQNEREWKKFCDTVIRAPDLATDELFCMNSKRVAHREQLAEIIREAFAALSADEVVERLEEAGIANAQVNDMHDVWNHRQLRARERWTQVETPAGPVPALYPPGLTAQDEPVMAPVPALGEHTHAILLGLGYDESRIAELHERHVV